MGLAESETSGVYFDSSSISISSNKAIFYEHYSFEGKSYSLTAGQSVVFNGGNGSWNDKISSFRIGSGVRVKLCKHYGCSNDNGKPGYIEFVGPVQVTSDFFWNDDISEIYTYPYDAKKSPRVMVFADYNYEGYS